MLHGRKPNGVRRFTLDERLLIIAVTSMIIALIFICYAGQCYGPLAGMYQVATGGAFLFFIAGIALIALVTLRRIDNDKRKGLSILFDTAKYKDFCFNNKLYTTSYYDPNEMNFPSVVLVEGGFAVSALPGIAKKLEDSKDLFNQYLAINGCRLYVYKTEAPGDGWIYYRVRENFKEDKLDGNE